MGGKTRVMTCCCTAWLLSTAAEASAQAQEATTQPATRPATAPASEPSLAESLPGASVLATLPASKPASVYKGMSLDQLMNVEVVSVSRRESTIGQSPAAVAVITQEDIRRAGALSIPEALRMAPGLEVAQIDRSTWAISARGFNNNTANKLLVLMDGRSVYTPLYSGVFWDVQDTMMQDIDRIEVIRGPAGALWGANAVNGVINVITKDAKETQGLLFSAGGGTEERNFEDVRYGWKIGTDFSARVYVKHFERDETARPNGMGGQDDWMMTQTGFRMDWEPSGDSHYTFQGDLYQGDRSSSTPDDTNLLGGNLLGRWTQNLPNGADMKLQVYYDGTKRDEPLAFGETRNTFDVDYQYHTPVWGQQDLTLGVGYRVTADTTRDGPFIKFDPHQRTEQLFSAFVQDEIQIVPDQLRLTLGSKFEHNVFTGFEIQPSARLLWTINKRQSAWAAISRAVRTPTQLEEDLRIVVGPGAFLPNRDFQSEEVLAYELGYRLEPVDWLSLDFAAYYNNYNHLQSTEYHPPLQFQEGNTIDGQTYGLEIGTTWKVTDWWTIHGANTLLHEQLQKDPGSQDFTTIATKGDNPGYQAYVRSSMDLARNLDLDVSVRYVSELANLHIPAYVAADVRVAWRPTPKMELSIVGQNLFDNQHPEFVTGGSTFEIQRGVFAMLTYKW